MTMIDTSVCPQVRYFPSRIALLAAAELVLIALLLRLSNSPAFFAAAIACSLCSIQLGVLLINRFNVNTRRIRQLAREAEFSSQGVLITDAAGKIKWTNPRFTRLTGFYLSEIAGQTFGMILHGQDTQVAAVETIRRQMRMGQMFEVELLEYNRAGESFWVCSQGQPIHDTRGNLTHYIITQTDITDQHRLIEELGKSSTLVAGASLADPNAETVTSLRVADLTKKLEALSNSDERQHLQNLINGIKTRVDQCVASLPQQVADKAKASSASQNQQNDG